VLTVGQLAVLSGVPATTLRYYDAIGVLTARRLPNGHRRYDDKHVERLELIKLCRALGLSLDDVGALLTSGDGARRRDIAGRKVRELDRTLAQMHSVRAVLAHFARCQHGVEDQAACRRAVRRAWRSVNPEDKSAERV
jgi:DNA-binding transcriptional MerR regulator